MQQGKWWFSQVVGNDPESYGTHVADVKITTTWTDRKTKKKRSSTRYYCGAFDIVLTDVPIFKDLRPRQTKVEKGKTVTEILNQGVPVFGVFVKAMRDNGIVAWHRWVGESPSTSENEMHCIDPATPFLKRTLNRQIDDFIDNAGTGGSGYPSEPATDPFAITPAQRDRARNRRMQKLPIPGALPDNT